MERTDILALMGELKLYGMRAAYDEVMASGIKRQHEPPRIVGDLLKAEIAEKQALSDQVSDDHRQTAAGQGPRRLRVRRARPSTKPWCAICPMAAFWPSSATLC